MTYGDAGILQPFLFQTTYALGKLPDLSDTRGDEHAFTELATTFTLLSQIVS